MQCWNCSKPCHYHTCDSCKAPQYNARAPKKQGEDKNGPSTLYLEQGNNGYWYLRLWGHNYDSPARIKIRDAVLETQYLSFASSDTAKHIALACPHIDTSDSAQLTIIFYTSNESDILHAAIKLAAIAMLELEIY